MYKRWLAKEAQKICAKGGLRLHKFVCNDRSVLQSIPPTYGQCSYLRHVNEAGDVHCTLIMGKSRVAPIKVMTIPRLELTAAVVSVAASNTLKEELGLADIDEYFWTDSKVVLGYVNNEARRFHTFVSNRIQKIHLSTTPQQWRYVSTNDNPADLASRGSTAKEILTSNWLTGPWFLWEKEIQPAVDVITEIQIGDPEVKRIQTHIRPYRPTFKVFFMVKGHSSCRSSHPLC